MQALLADVTSDTTMMLIVGGFVVGGILAYQAIAMMGRVSMTRCREQSRREFAAYVAEGSLTPETAERLMKADTPDNWNDRIARMVHDGVIDSNDAERLLRALPKSQPAPAPGAAV